ncbi:hypothetical protein AOLI_G00290290 [Acnodon oligacanthus]
MVTDLDTESREGPKLLRLESSPAAGEEQSMNTRAQSTVFNPLHRRPGNHYKPCPRRGKDPELLCVEQNRLRTRPA